VCLQLIEERAQWDAVNDQWHIPGIEYAGNHMRRADPPDELYRPAPISYERLSRMVGGSIQQQQLLSLAASAATCDAEYECVINGAPVPVVNFRFVSFFLSTFSKIEILILLYCGHGSANHIYRTAPTKKRWRESWRSVAHSPNRSRRWVTNANNQIILGYNTKKLHPVLV
jgi:hypothetical protein